MLLLMSGNIELNQKNLKTLEPIHVLVGIVVFKSIKKDPQVLLESKQIAMEIKCHLNKYL